MLARGEKMGKGKQTYGFCTKQAACENAGVRHLNTLKVKHRGKNIFAMITITLEAFSGNSNCANASSASPDVKLNECERST